MSRIAVIGTGYVGLSTGAYLAHIGHEVVCADVVADKIAGLARGEVPIFEAGLEDLVRSGLDSGLLRFVLGSEAAVPGAEFVFLCLPTPQGDDGAADLSYMQAEADHLGPLLEPGSIVINKSTVPVGSTRLVQRSLERGDVFVVSNPEFLREGTAVHDCLNPDRIVIGADDAAAASRVAALYDRIHAPVIVTDPASAELIKYASNAFLATKISYINAIANLCEAVGADVREVVLGMGYDKRIGFEFLRPGPGWGGSCFPKDSRALVRIAEDAGYDFELLKGVIAVNDQQFERMTDKIAKAAPDGVLDGSTVAVWGLTFKALTDDLRDSPALEVVGRLLRARGEGPGVRPHGRPPAGQRRRAAGGRDHLQRSVRGLHGRRRGCPAHGVGRVPLARLRQGQLAASGPGRRRLPQRPRPGGHAQAWVHLSRRGPRVRVVVSGGAGFLGSHLCRALLDRGDEVVCIDNLVTGDEDNVAELMTNRAFSFILHDVSNHVIVKGPVDAVMHLASPASPKDFAEIPIKILKVGSLGTHNMVGLAKAKGARFFLASTSEVYGDPLIHPQPETYWGNVNPIGPRSVYDEAKRFAEAMTMAYHRQHGVDVRVVRIFNTFGPRMRVEDGRVVSNFIVQALQGKPLTIYGDGRQTRSFTYVDDEIRGFLALLDSDYVGPVNIGNPDEFTVSELAHLVVEITGSSSSICHEPLPVDDPTRRRPDITLARSVLGWEPVVDLREGLLRTAEWFRGTI